MPFLVFIEPSKILVDDRHRRFRRRSVLYSVASISFLISIVEISIFVGCMRRPLAPWVMRRNSSVKRVSAVHGRMTCSWLLMHSFCSFAARKKMRRRKIDFTKMKTKAYVKSRMRVLVHVDIDMSDELFFRCECKVENSLTNRADAHRWIQVDLWRA